MFLYHRIKLNFGCRVNLVLKKRGAIRMPPRSLAFLVAQCPDRDVGPHFEGVESLALRVAVDVGVLPAIA